MRIRKFRVSDARRTSYLVRKTMRHSLSAHYCKTVVDALCRVNTPARIIKRASARQYFVAIENKRMVGFMGIKGNEIKTAFVNPRYQGKSIGAALLKRIEEYAKSKSVDELKVHSSIPAEKFYNKMGFKRLRRMKSSVENLQFTDILMKKKL